MPAMKCCFKVNELGFRGDLIVAKLQDNPVEQPRRALHSIERCKLIAKSKGCHRALFQATGGGALTSDDMFIGMELPIHNSEIKSLEATRASRLTLKANQDSALAIINRIPPTPRSKLNANKLEILLTWYRIPKKYIGKKEQKVMACSRIVNYQKPLLPFNIWTEEDKEQLVSLKNKNLI